MDSIQVQTEGETKHKVERSSCLRFVLQQHDQQKRSIFSESKTRGCKVVGFPT